MSAPELAFMRFVELQQGLGFDVAFSSRTHRKRVGDGLVSRGMLTTIDAVVCDGDGFTKGTEHYRKGYALTPGGRAMLTLEPGTL